MKNKNKDPERVWNVFPKKKKKKKSENRLSS